MHLLQPLRMSSCKAHSFFGLRLVHLRRPFSASGKVIVATLKKISAFCRYLSSSDDLRGPHFQYNPQRRCLQFCCIISLHDMLSMLHFITCFSRMCPRLLHVLHVLHCLRMLAMCRRHAKLSNASMKAGNS